MSLIRYKFISAFLAGGGFVLVVAGTSHTAGFALMLLAIWIELWFGLGR